MAAFTSPIAGPASWTLTASGLVTVPSGLRYAGERLPALRAEIATPGTEVRMPALGVLRKVTPATGAPDAGRTFVEVQVNPFPIRFVVQGLPFGLPTFYLVFDVGSGPAAFDDGNIAAVGDALGTVTGLTILCAGQDRVARDPALWSKQILDAVRDGGGTVSAWEPFADAVVSQTATGAGAPVPLLDHVGRRRDSGAVEIVAGATTVTATLDPADQGDLQRAVARLHAADPGAMPLANLFGGGVSSVTLRPAPGAAGDRQLARLEDGTHAGGAIAATPTERHVTFTDLHAWFAPQFVTPAPAGFEPLAHYTRNNRLTPLVNGPEYFDDLFRRLQAARAAGAQGGFHLTGWSMFPEVEFTKRGLRADDVADMPITLAQAAEMITGGTRFLPAKFFHLDPMSTVTTAEMVLVSTILMTLLLSKDVDFVRSDAAGAVILVALFVINAIAVGLIVGADGRPIEPNKDAVDVLHPIANAESRFSPFPAAVADNPLSPPLSSWLYTQLFTLIRNFGIYHQKFALVRTGTSRVGYCGGIDVNPDRLDDIRHLAKHPYHDVHALVEGRAVRDLELSFNERWSRDGGGSSLAFEPATADDHGDPGSDAVQVARTYFQAADPARALAFAPNGDRTIADTMIRGIEAATEFIYIEDQYVTPPEEYRNALLAKLTGPNRIRKLVIAMPGITDQPFGELARSAFIADLRAADAAAGGGIVHIGYPRRHYTLPDNELRASSGRCLLGATLTASSGIDPAVFLGPEDRVPQPPFWLSIDGELMYAFNESTAGSPTGHKGFEVLRGADTRLIKGGPVATAIGPRVRAHAQGAAATVIDLSDIYVHAKMMIVDDVFVGIGSANLNRRGLFHDGEINVFSVPQTLKASRANPIAKLRRRLWAEMLDLPLAAAEPLLEDPIAAARLFERSPLAGNRYTDIEAYPTHLMFDATGGDGLVGTVIKLIVGSVVLVDHEELFDGIIDPTSAVGGA